MALERCRDAAHVPAVRLGTQVPEQALDFLARGLKTTGCFHSHGTPPVDTPR
jgi:hypothetical protein